MAVANATGVMVSLLDICAYYIYIAGGYRIITHPLYAPDSVYSSINNSYIPAHMHVK